MVVDVDVDGEGGDGEAGLLRASAAASSHAVRAEGSTGQVEGGGDGGACWTGVEDVLPIVACICIYCLRINVWTQDGTSNIPKFRRGIKALGQNYWRMHKALESLAPKIKKKPHPLMISDQIAYKLKCAIEHFFPPKIFLIQYCLLLPYSSIIIQVEKKTFEEFQKGF